MLLPDPGDVFECAFMASLGWYGGKAILRVAYAVCRRAAQIVEDM